MRKETEAAYVMILLVILVGMMIYGLANPELTSTQVFLEGSPYIAGLFVLVAVEALVAKLRR